jgi:hypothetical protein
MYARARTSLRYAEACLLSDALFAWRNIMSRRGWITLTERSRALQAHNAHVSTHMNGGW